MPTFTLDQKKAHDPRRHMAITANAGSGKTRVLVSRYCDLVEHLNVSPEKIAAITFTEKAASELRGKIAEELDRRLTDDEHRGQWSRLKLGRERFRSAIVSTIHGFCAQVLREFPIESNVPPNFGVTSGYERRRLLDEAVMDGIEHALGEGSAAFERVYALARKIGREQMEAILRMMVDRREMITMARIDGPLTWDREHAVDTWIATVEGMLRAALLDPAIIAVIDRMMHLMKPEPAAVAFALLGDLRAARTPADLLERATALQEALLTTAGTVRKRSYALKGEEFAVLDDDAALLVAAFKRVGRFLGTDAGRALHGELFDDTQTLLEIYEDIIRRYRTLKDRSNVLDFEDLQLRLLEALDRTDDEDADTLRERLAERFEHIMIDEFQDTNELQYGIARRILRGLDVGRLTIVGDTKQSIYGFRNADVEVFAHARGEITAANARLGRVDAPLTFRSEELAPDDEERAGVIKLAASFRLLPSICAYVNEACSSLLVRRPGALFGVDYEPLVCARRSTGRGAVEVILAAQAADTEEAGETFDETEAPLDEPGEAVMIARRIARLVAGEERVVWETEPGAAEETPRPARFGDIAVLCRKRSFFPAIEAAFRRLGIPFATYGGAGFYRTQEIYDMLGYLRTLLNARDDVALLGVLRSPFFCVSDAEIYRVAIGSVRTGRDLWSRALERVRSGQADAPLTRAVTMLEDDRAMAGRVAPSVLLRRVIERTGWRGSVIGAERGEQNLANVDKLLEMAREFEARGFTNLFDFVERIGEMVESEEMEGEAALNTGRDAVHLMTMHASKGLEFPIVILPSLHAPVRTSSGPALDKDLGLGWNWQFNGVEYRPAVTALLQLRAAERERAEEARLFYVATTRARDMLILSGETGTDGPPQGTMLAWALAPFGYLPIVNSEVALRTRELVFLDADGTTEHAREWEQTAVVHRSIDEPDRSDAAVATVPVFRAEAVRIGELPAHASGEIYSATQFQVHHHCPTKYYLKYRLGVPESVGAAYGESPDAVESDDGLLFARLYRGIAASLDVAIDPEHRGLLRDEEGRPVALDRLITQALSLEPLIPEEEAALRARLTATFERLLASDIARELLAPAGSNALTNYQLTMPFGSEFIMGTIDRVVENEAGMVAAIQYKTRRLSAEACAAAAESSLTQLRIYAYLLAALRPEQRAITCTVLFTEHPDHPQTYSFSRFETRRIEEEMRAAVEDIRAITYSGTRALPTRTPHCSSCAYWIGSECLLARSASAQPVQLLP